MNNTPKVMFSATAGEHYITNPDYFVQLRHPDRELPANWDEVAVYDDQTGKIRPETALIIEKTAFWSVS